MARKALEVVQSNNQRSNAPDGAEIARIAALGRALSDPIRVRMLGMMAAGRGCCDLPECGVPVEDQAAGICVCEFERSFDMGQSKVSYHLGKLKEAGLVRERRRGKWSFYSLDRDAVRGLLGETARHLGILPEPCEQV